MGFRGSREQRAVWLVMCNGGCGREMFRFCQEVMAHMDCIRLRVTQSSAWMNERRGEMNVPYERILVAPVNLYSCVGAA